MNNCVEKCNVLEFEMMTIPIQQTMVMNVREEDILDIGCEQAFKEMYNRA